MTKDEVQPPPIPAALITARELARSAKVTPQFLAKLRKQGKGPPWISLGSRAVRYRITDANQWLESLTKGASHG